MWLCGVVWCDLLPGIASAASRGDSAPVVELCQRGTTPSMRTGADSGRDCLAACKYCVTPTTACRGVCESFRAKGDAVQPEGSSMPGVADVVGWDCGTVLAGAHR
jgi:hypothetical protein